MKNIRGFYGIYVFLLNEKASLDHGWSIFGQIKILHSNCGECIALQNLCVEKDTCCHPQGILFAETVCQGDLSHVFASEPTTSIF